MTTDLGVAESFLEAGLEYAARGWPVFPVWGVTDDGRCRCGNPMCERVGKHPLGRLVPRGLKDATTDEATIRVWWEAEPEANIARATGDVFVLDVDPRNGGSETLAQLEAQFGPLPQAPEVLTGGGGRHIYFAMPTPPLGNSAGTKLGRGLDTRGVGGYVLLPPSRHASGQAYRERPDRPLDWTPLPPVPAWLMERLSKPADGPGRSTNPPGWADELIDGVPEGTRDETCVRLIGRYAQMRPPLSKAEVTQFMLAWARKSVDRQGKPFPAEVVLEKIDRLFKVMERELVDFPLTDAGNAERLVAVFGDRFRWMPEGKDRGDWFVWDGRRWAPGSIDRVRAFALEAIRITQMAAVRLKAEEKRSGNSRRAIIKHALASESAVRINAAVQLARIIPGVALDRARLDTQPFLLNVANGTLDLKTGRLRPHDPADLLTQIIEVPYDPAAKAPRWRRFLGEVFLGKQDVIDYVQRAVGYTITGSIEEQVLFLLQGIGANGKSTLVDTVKGVLGDDYATKIEAEALLAAPKHHGLRGRPTPELVAMAGRRLGCVDEMPEGRFLDEARIKSLTGSSEETGRGMYQAQSTWANTIKLWFDVNNLPSFKGIDEGIARRPRIIPFDRKFEESEQEKGLTEKLLRNEAPGILAWMVEGCRQWLERGLDPPEAVSMATRAYVETQNHLPRFFEEMYVKDPAGRTPVAVLRPAYERWCYDQSEIPMEQAKLNLFLTEVWKLRQDRHGVRTWVGLKERAETQA